MSIRKSLSTIEFWVLTGLGLHKLKSKENVFLQHKPSFLTHLSTFRSTAAATSLYKRRSKEYFREIRSAAMEGETLNIKKWVVLYPIYINSKKTVAEGRRISTAKACENPTCVEIDDCCRHLKLKSAIEIDKAYPRDFMQRGRVRVLLKREDGSLCNPAIGSRKQLMLQVAELVPRHPGRTKKQEPAATISTAAAGSTKTGGGSSKAGGKGGKKKK